MSLAIWGSSSALEGLMIVLLIFGLPPAAVAGTAIDVAGRALHHRLRAAR